MKKILILFLTVLFVSQITGIALSTERETAEITKRIVEYEKNIEEYSHKKSKEMQKDIYLAELQEQYTDHQFRLYAQAPDIPFPPGMKDPEPSSNKRHGLRSRLMFMYGLVDYLNLDEETAAKFFPAHLEYSDKRDKLLKEHRELIATISKQAEDETVSVNVLKKKVEQLRRLEKSMDEEKEKFFEKSKKILDERQYIKLIVFKDKFKLDLMERFRSDRSKRTTEDSQERIRNKREDK